MCDVNHTPCNHKALLMHSRGILNPLRKRSRSRTELTMQNCLAFFQPTSPLERRILEEHTSLKAFSLPPKGQLSFLLILVFFSFATGKILKSLNAHFQPDIFARTYIVSNLTRHH